jgi:hypothetical protein
MYLCFKKKIFYIDYNNLINHIFLNLTNQDLNFNDIQILKRKLLIFSN